MRYAVISDVHANLEALQAVLADIKIQKCTDIVCLGDIVGYGANPRECLGIIRDLHIPVVRGNHDEYVGGDENLEGVSRRAAEAVFWTRKQLGHEDRKWLRELKYLKVVANFSIVHATLDTPQRWGYIFGTFDAAASFAFQGTQVCFFGHTHVPAAFVKDTRIRLSVAPKIQVEQGAKYFVNLGSVGQPRDGDPRAAYGIYDLAAQTIELRRLAYDVESAQNKIRSRSI
jgi:diadenosine tetraphosphatase ApaH/serine/threonine PP2A family protein phosphatase